MVETPITVKVRAKYRAQAAGPDRDAMGDSRHAGADLRAYYVKGGAYRGRHATKGRCCNDGCGAAWRKRERKLSRYNFARAGAA